MTITIEHLGSGASAIGQGHREWKRGGGALASAGRAALLLAMLFAFAPGALAAEAPSRKGGLEGVVNINTASAEQLQLLPGVGKSRAQAIVERRKENGGFTSIEQLQQVKGIGPAMLKRMRPHVALRGKTTARRVGAGKPPGKAAAR